MKHIITVALFGASIQVGANDLPLDSQRVQNLLSQNSTATELNWQHKDLANDDFKGLGIVASHVKKLNLSNNHFSGDFPLTACLKAFPNLETLTINNHERMRGFEIEQGYKNDKLTVLSAENNGCETVSITHFYNLFGELETLDLSDSKQLETLDHKNYCLRASGKALNVYLRNVVAGQDRLNYFRESGMLETSASRNIQLACVAGGAIIGGSILISCGVLAPNYYVENPIPTQAFKGQWPYWINMGINTLLGITASCLLVHRIGSMIASRCLPNGGKVTAVKFITNSADETA